MPTGGPKPMSEKTTKKRRSVICQKCNMRPVMDRCSICEECWYARPSFSDDMHRFAAAVIELARGKAHE